MKFPNPLDALEERSIETPGGPFVLQLKRPTYQDRLEDDNLGMLAFGEADEARGLAKKQIRRIERCCVGWLQVEDAAGEPVPFSIDAFARVLSAWPEVAGQVDAILRELYAVKVAPLGESSSRPAAGTEAAPSAAG